MIRYALECRDCETGFEAWFGSSSVFETQVEAGQVECPNCGGHDIRKQVMAPSVRPSERSGASDPEKVFGKLAAQARQHIAENYDYVGDGFAEEARSMYYGERDHRPIWGETTADERESLKEEGVPAAPLPPAFVPPKSSDKTKLN
ncbi:MAG: hypothetical protein CME84_00710 [Henriciella sp.]|jgi:hypothetical protein|uniref:DUF1178 family protein n=1 Tax=uncultured Henriciella sp. TaxID=1608424 RepID=UPI000C410BA7|nr:hypothetical protein [Henriciella sp.]MBF33135.1 hypothetical protein [Hyphomonadaceae bacterium]|tara:strand:- start:3569 stop:4006 length:438 start_codon:yes stop_codon:yes gene_type:complete